MSAAAWRFVWEWGGHRGTATDIDPAWTEVASLYGGGTSQRQVAVAFVPAGLSVAAIVEAGLHPAAGYGSLYLGDLLVIAGRWVSATYDADGAPLEVVISEAPDDELGSWPPTATIERWGWSAYDAAQRLRRAASGEALRSGAIDQTAWPGSVASSSGIPYPVVIGSPGTFDHPAVPAPIVYDLASPVIWLLASGGPASGSAWVFGFDQSKASSNATPTIARASALDAFTGGTDGYGVPVALITPTMGTGVGGNGLDYTDGATYATSWSAAGTGLPGGAGDLLGLVAAASSLRLDVGAWQAAAGWLNRYRLDGYLDQRVPPLALIRAQLAPLLPIGIVSTTRGIAPAIWPWADGAHHGSLHVIAGHGFAPASRVSYGGAPLPGLALAYGYDIMRATYTGRALATPDTHAGARVAASVAGSSPVVQEMQSRLVWDDLSAQRIVTDKLSQLALPRRQRSYLADPAIYGPGGARELWCGRAIDITDDGVRWSRRAAVVSAVERSAASMRVTLTLRDDVLLGA